MPGTISDAKIRLNGVDYVVDGDIVVSRLEPWAEALRVVGNRRPQDRTNTDQQIVQDFSKGIGYFTASESNLDSLKGLFDSTCETRWRGQVTPPGLVVTPTQTNAHAYDRFWAFGSSLYASGGILTANLSIAVYNAGNWDQSKDLTGAGYNNFAISSATYHNGSMYLYGTSAATVPATTVRLAAAWADVTPAVNFTQRPRAVLSFNDTLYALTDNGTSLFTMEQSIDDGANWTVITGAEITEARNRVCYLVEYKDAGGDPAIYALVSNGLYIFDIPTSDIGVVIRFPKPINNMANAEPLMFNGKLYIPTDGSLIEFDWSTQTWIDISPLTNRSTALAATAIIRALADAGGRWLFAAIDDDVFAYDPMEDAWHFIASFGTNVSDIIVHDGILHAVLTDGTFRRVDNVLTDPLRTSGKTFAVSGTIVTPHNDADMPEASGVVVAQGLSASQLATTAAATERIQSEIEVNYSGSYALTANIKTWYSDTASPPIQKYSSDAAAGNVGTGLAALSWRHRFTLTRGSTTTNRPVFHKAVNYFRKLYTDLHAYVVIIDLAATVANYRRAFSDEDAVITSLHAAMDSTVLVPFTYPGIKAHDSAVTTRYVLAKTYQSDEVPNKIAQAIEQRLGRGSRFAMILEELL